MGILGGDGSGLLPVVSSLVNVWQTDPKFKSIWAASKVPDDEVRRALLALLRGGKLPMLVLAGQLAASVVAKIGGGDRTKIDSIIGAIQSVQDDLGIAVDGVIGHEVMLAIEEKFRNCVDRSLDDAQPLNPNGATSIINQRRDKHIVGYFVSDFSASKLLAHRVHSLLADAWAPWIDPLMNAITVAQVDDLEDSNVLVELATIDGQGNTLGLAHVGGPRFSQRLVCTLDAKELWTDDKLKFVAMHEFGHILGLDHNSDPSSIMFRSYSPGSMKAPSQSDIDRLKAIWGV